MKVSKEKDENKFNTLDVDLRSLNSHSKRTKRQTSIDLNRFHFQDILHQSEIHFAKVKKKKKKLLGFDKKEIRKFVPRSQVCQLMSVIASVQNLNKIKENYSQK